MTLMQHPTSEIKRQTLAEIRKQAKFLQQQLNATESELLKAKLADDKLAERTEAMTEAERDLQDRENRLLGRPSPLRNAGVRKGELERECKALKRALSTLRREETAAEIVAGLEWKQKNLSRWNAEARAVIVAYLEFDRCLARTRSMLAEPGPDNVKMPLDRYLGSFFEIHWNGDDHREFLDAAVKSGLSSKDEIAEARKRNEAEI